MASGRQKNGYTNGYTMVTQCEKSVTIFKINGVRTPKNWLHNAKGYSSFQGKKTVFRAKKRSFSPLFNPLLRLRGTGEERAFQSAWTPILVVVIQAIIANSVATSACFTKFFINGIERFLSSLFSCVGRDEKANGN